MTKDEALKLAKQAGFERLGHTDNDWVCDPKDIEAFADLIRADEREACAKVIESHGPTLANGMMLAEAIRARRNT